MSALRLAVVISINPSLTHAGLVITPGYSNKATKIFLAR